MLNMSTFVVLQNIPSSVKANSQQSCSTPKFGSPSVQPTGNCSEGFPLPSTTTLNFSRSLIEK
jgi:hypothetical protein